MHQFTILKLPRFGSTYRWFTLAILNFSLFMISLPENPKENNSIQLPVDKATPEAPIK